MPVLENLQKERDEAIELLHTFSDLGLSIDDFKAEIDAQYAAALASGEAGMPGATGIHLTVPPIPDYCGAEAMDAQ